MRSLHSAKSVRVELYSGRKIAFIPDGIDGESANNMVDEVYKMIREAEKKGEKYLRSRLAGQLFAISSISSVGVASPRYISLADDDTNGWSTKGKYDLLPGEILVVVSNGYKVYLGVPADIDYSDSKLYVGNEKTINQSARPVIAEIKKKYPVIVDNLNKVLFGYNESEEENV